MAEPPANEHISLADALRPAARRWKPIVLLSAAAAVLVGVVSSLLPESYRASALVLVNAPAMTTRLDPRFELRRETAGDAGLADIAESPDALLQAYERARAEQVIEPDVSAPQFIERCSAAWVGEGLLELSADAPDARSAAGICNVWAPLVVKRFNTLLQVSEAEIESTLQRVDEAQQRWVQAQRRLDEQLPAIQLAARELEFQAAQEQLTSLLNVTRQMELLLNDAQLVRQRLSRQEMTQRAALGDSLAVVRLQSHLSNTDAEASDQLRVELSADSAGDLTTVRQLLDQIEHLVAGIQAQQSTLNDQTSQQRRNLTQLALTLEQAEHEQALLTEQRDAARAAFAALANQVEQMRLAAAEATPTAKLATRATPPMKPAWPRPVLFALAASVLVAVLLTLLALIRGDRAA